MGAGNLLYGVELYHDDGPWTHPDDDKKANAVLRWSEASASTHFNVTAWAYRGDFNSTDQILLQGDKSKNWQISIDLGGDQTASLGGQ